MITRIIAEQNRDLQLVGAKDNIQIQMANDEQDAYINVNRSEAKLLAEALIKHCREDEKPKAVKMRFKDAPIGARFSIVGCEEPRKVYVKVSDADDGLIVHWHGNEQTFQNMCCWVDEGCDFDTIIDVIE